MEWKDYWAWYLCAIPFIIPIAFFSGVFLLYCVLSKNQYGGRTDEIENKADE